MYQQNKLSGINLLNLFGVFILIGFSISNSLAQNVESIPKPPIGNWIMECVDKVADCRATYPKFFVWANNELDESVKYYNSLGFANAEFKIRTIPEIGTGRYIRINQTPSRTGEFAAYITDAKKPKFQSSIFLFDFPKYDMFDNRPTGTPRKIATEAKLKYTLTHEIFHGFQRLKAFPINNDKKIEWIQEATAEAAGYAFTSQKYRRLNFGNGEYFYNVSLNEEPEKPREGEPVGYERGHFIYSVGKMINPNMPMQWVSNLYKQPADTSRFGYDWLNQAIRKTRLKSLPNAYIKFIAEYANEKKYYYFKEKKGVANSDQPKVPKVIVKLRDEYPTKKKGIIVKQMSATPLNTEFAKEVFRKVPDSKPGEYVALLEIELKPTDTDDNLVLVVENNIADKNNKRKIVVPAALDDNKKEFFVRGVNAPRPIDPLSDRTFDVELSAKTIRLSASECVAPGETQPIVFEPSKPDSQLKITSKYGKIDKNYNYTAPQTGVTDELKVELLTGITKQNGKAKWNKKEFLFATPKVSQSGCQFRLRTADGYTLTFDASKQLTKTEGRKKNETAYFDREFIYVNEPSMGWIKLRASQAMAMFKMPGKSSAGAGIPSTDEFGRLLGIVSSQAFADPMKWGRAPYDFLFDLERQNLDKKRGRRVTNGGSITCPKGGGTCTVYRIDGKDTVYYNKANQIHAIRTKNGIHLVEYGNYPLKKPVGAKLLTF